MATVRRNPEMWSSVWPQHVAADNVDQLEIWKQKNLCAWAVDQNAHVTAINNQLSVVNWIQNSCMTICKELCS
jgi:hypothetical protein